MPYKWTLIQTNLSLTFLSHILRSLCILLLFLYIVFCIVYCFMHTYDRTTRSRNLTCTMFGLYEFVLDDLIESVYYMFIPMQNISVIRIFSCLCINIQSSYICKLPCSETKSHKLSLQKCKSPLALWPPRGVTSTELKRPHFSGPPHF